MKNKISRENELEHTFVEEVFLGVIGGSSILDCIHEAIIFAAKNEVKVRFSHNGVIVEIELDTLIEKIYEKWAKGLKKKVKDHETK